MDIRSKCRIIINIINIEMIRAAREGSMRRIAMGFFGLVLLAGCGSSGSEAELLNVSYDPTRELWRDLNALSLAPRKIGPAVALLAFGSVHDRAPFVCWYESFRRSEPAPAGYRSYSRGHYFLRALRAA